MKTKVMMVVGFLFLFAWSAVGTTADFPQRPIRMIVPWSAGGGSDVLCRAFQPALEKELGQRILIENIPAGSTKVGTLELMKAKPDGYTLLFSNEAWISRYYAKTYDVKVWEKMTPVGNVTTEPLAFVEVRAESPLKTWGDLVKAAKENPGKLSCGNPGVGSPLDIVFKEISDGTGINVQYVPFAGGGQSKTALLGGHVDACSSGIDWPPFVLSGQLKVLATHGEKRSPYFPDTPTLKELGYGFVSETVHTIAGPAGMPPDVVRKLESAIKKATEQPEFKTLLGKLYLTPAYMGSKEYDQHLKEKWGKTEKMFKEMGIIKEAATQPY